MKCKECKLELVKGLAPFTEDHWQCIICDSTYPIWIDDMEAKDGSRDFKTSQQLGIPGPPT